MSATRELRPTTITDPSPAEGGCAHMNISDWFSMLRAYAQREEGQTMAEYGVVLAVITLGVIAALTLLAGAITGKLGAVTGKLNLP